MSVKEIFEMIYAVLFVGAMVIAVYATKHQTKNKLVDTVEKLSTAFVHSAETLDVSGSKKMGSVVDAVEDVLKQKDVKVDAAVDSMIRAFAEKEVAKMNADKPSVPTAEPTATEVSESDSTPAETAGETNA